MDLTCIDFWGNGSGNINGCPLPTDFLILDPEFCDLKGRDFRINAESPCAPEHSPPGCGLIGALPPDCSITSVEPQETTDAPVFPFGLEVANPLRPGAGPVHITLPWAANVRLDLFDVTGRHLRTLAAGHFLAGKHAFAWDELQSGGHPLPAGVIFMRLTDNSGRQAVEKVVLLR
jgi:hypothetical protein